jgi:hypothetical protein
MRLQQHENRLHPRWRRHQSLQVARTSTQIGALPLVYISPNPLLNGQNHIHIQMQEACRMTPHKSASTRKISGVEPDGERGRHCELRRPGPLTAFEEIRPRADAFPRRFPQRGLGAGVGRDINLLAADQPPTNGRTQQLSPISAIKLTAQIFNGITFASGCSTACR